MDAPAPPKSRKPEDTAFKQQRLPAWQPILTPFWVIVTFLVIGIVFLPLGVVLKTESDSIVEYSIQYDGEGTAAEYASCQLANASVSKVCTLSFKVNKAMKAPVYLYYQLDNFYQNHRRYVKSRSDSQLMGEVLPASSLSDCEPLTSITVNGQTYTLSPCGLIANSFFNDFYTLTTTGVSLDENDIAWQSDVDYRFAQPDGFKKAKAVVAQTCDQTLNVTGAGTAPYIENGVSSNWCYWYPDSSTYYYLHQRYPTFPNLAIEGVTNEYFIVWMRTAGLPTFRKLYGKVNKDIPAGSTITFTVNANFEVASFSGKKYLILSTVSWFGGKNDFLGISYIVVGSICLALAVAFAAKQMICPRKLGDTRYLGWKEQ